MSSPSSSMGNGDVIALGSVIAAILFGGGLLAVTTQLGTSSAKKPPTSHVPSIPTAVPKAQTLQSCPESTQAETSQPSLIEPVLSKETQSSPKRIDGKDELGIYREWQDDNMCGKHALNTVLAHFNIPPITKAEFVKKVPRRTAELLELIEFADSKGLEARPAQRDIAEHKNGSIDDHTAEFIGAGIDIDRIDEAEAFIIMEPCIKSLHHYVAMVKINGLFHLSDSLDQDKREVYTGSARKAFAEYQRKHNITAYAVLTFQAR
jgi:hypothetical protein